MTNGREGECPDWYFPAKAALFWNVSPDEAIAMPVFWIDAAAIISEAENAVKAKRDAMEAKRRKAKRG